MAAQKLKTQQSAPKTVRKNETVLAERLAKIDGRHPLQTAVGDFHVPYKVRYRKGAKLAYFNVDLAIDMGLIDSRDTLPTPAKLEKLVLEAFSLQIINEYDIENKIKFDPKDIREYPRMATRYLQLQHANKQGKNSGDGRSIWNGQFTSKGRVWDISSCGTGATILSPAAAELGRPIKTGDKDVCYGCGYGDFYDGLAGVLMSEIFHKNGIPTERTLAVLRFEGGKSINVRVASNLLRPAHMFRYLKLGDRTNLRKLCDYFIDREIKNKNPELSDGKNKYQALKKYLARGFGRSAALYERKYVFCWFEWDGDNILAKDAGILDYGSVRQFGLFHKEYRYDDTDRWSTNLLEQRTKARYIVQTIEQMIDFVETGVMKPVRKFAKGEAAKIYDEVFEYNKKSYLLEQCGFPKAQISEVLKKHKQVVSIFERSFEFFERIQSAQGIHEVPDGITSDAVFCMRDFMREIPKEYLAKWDLLSQKELLALMKSSYATGSDASPRTSWNVKTRELQRTYQKLVDAFAKAKGIDRSKMLLEMVMRSSVLNRFDQITGNGILEVTGYLCNQFPLSKTTEIQAIAEAFIAQQSRDGVMNRGAAVVQSKAMRRLVHLVEANREEI
ncbi:MAG TPA: hypothetical protein VM901_12150 [Bdellovibrionota bacterium]|nr:hypothetical protein [Bdellovibrionota bacterium]